MHRLFRRASVVLAAVAGGLAACITTSEPGPVCDVLPAGIFVQVIDSVTGANAVATATAVARYGTYADSATGMDENQAGLWVGRIPGVYETRVSKAGYADWVRDNVIVTLGRCGVVGEPLLARLQPQ